MFTQLGAAFKVIELDEERMFSFSHVVFCGFLSVWDFFNLPNFAAVCDPKKTYLDITF